ncbi:pyruvate kinase [Bacteroidota bacterium]
MTKHTKIVATLSDEKCDIDFIKDLYQAGMNVVRINTAHQSPEGSIKLINNVRQVSEKIPFLVDTKGPEIRTTRVDEDIIVSKGDIIQVSGDQEKKSSSDCLYVNYDNFENEAGPGLQILIDDGDVALTILEKKEGKLLCEVNNSGVIKGRKSVNVPGISFRLTSVTERDRMFIDLAIKENLDFIAHSFVRNKDDVIAVQKLLDEKNSKIKIIAKIENQDGVDNINEILDHVYGIMIARGDLGIEIPAERIPVIQRQLIKKCTERKKPVIVATQMLHTMIKNPRPTRAEVSDIANAIYSRTDAIMLSGETAYGDYAVEAVNTMRKIALEVEKNRNPKKDFSVVSIDNKIAAFLSNAAVKAASQLSAKAVICDTLTGRTARYLSAFRGKNPVYAMCYKKSVVRELALSYGVFPDYMDHKASTDEFKHNAVFTLIEQKKIEPDDRILIIGGSFGPRRGASFIDIGTSKDMMKL